MNALLIVLITTVITTSQNWLLYWLLRERLAHNSRISKVITKRQAEIDQHVASTRGTQGYINALVREAMSRLGVNLETIKAEWQAEKLAKREKAKAFHEALITKSLPASVEKEGQSDV